MILACKLGNNLPSRSQTIKSVGRHDLVISFPCSLTTFAQQPSGGSVKIRATVASEWLGKFSFWQSPFSQCHVLMMPFVAPSTHRLAEIRSTRTLLLQRLSARTNQLWVLSLIHNAFKVFTHSLDNFQISDGGPVTGGVGAVATATPAPTSANSSNATASNSGSTSTSTPYTESSAGHLVVDGLFAFLALAFGITLA